MIKSLVTTFSLLLFVGCVGLPPVKEYNFAHYAIQSAQGAGASKYTPGVLNQAEETYQTALRLYENRQYEEAKEMFEKSRRLAEKSELKTRIKKFDLGETF